MVLHGSLDHARAGLSTLAVLAISINGGIWQVWAMVNTGKGYTGACQLGLHVGGEQSIVLLGIEPAGNARLIGDDDQPVTSILEKPHAFDCPRRETEIGWPTDIAVIDVDDAITIQKNRLY